MSENLPANLAVVANYKSIEAIVEKIMGTDFCPKAYQGKPKDVFVAVMMGLEVGLAPMQALQNIAVINGKPSLYGDGQLAVCQAHPQWGGISETFDDATMTATCTVLRHPGQSRTVTFSQADAQKANLWGKQGPWTQYPKRMLQMRARGFALRDLYADALRGMISEHEARDMPIDVTPAKEQPKELTAPNPLSPAPAPARRSTAHVAAMVEPPVETKPVPIEVIVSDEGAAIIDNMQMAAESGNLEPWWVENQEPVKAMFDGRTKEGKAALTAIFEHYKKLGGMAEPKGGR